MEHKGTFDIQEMNPTTMEFMLYVLSKDLLSCNEHDLSMSRNKIL
jgi:hypothetical protein